MYDRLRPVRRVTDPPRGVLAGFDRRMSRPRSRRPSSWPSRRCSRPLSSPHSRSWRARLSRSASSTPPGSHLGRLLRRHSPLRSRWQRRHQATQLQPTARVWSRSSRQVIGRHFRWLIWTSPGCFPHKSFRPCSHHSRLWSRQGGLPTLLMPRAAESHQTGW